MNLGGSSSRPSIPVGAIAIPAARKPFSGLKEPAEQSEVSLSWQFGHRLSGVRLRRLLGVVHGALVVVGVYVLIGAGIGLAAGSVMIGLGAGLLAGICAIAAILLVRGSAVAAGTANDSPCDAESVAAGLR